MNLGMDFLFKSEFTIHFGLPLFKLKYMLGTAFHVSISLLRGLYSFE